MHFYFNEGMMEYMILDVKDMLTTEESMRLFKRFEETNDGKYIDEVVTRSLRYVTFTVNKYKTDLVEFDDLFQEGIVGLLRATKRYRYDNPEGCGFLKYATFYIKEQVLSYIANNECSMKVATTKPMRKLFHNKKLVNSYPKPLSLESIGEIALKLDISENYVIENEIRRNNRFISSFTNDDGESRAIDVPTQAMQVTNLENDELVKGVKDSMDLLDKRSKDIIEKRYFTDPPITREELASTYNISQQRIAQLEKLALDAMKGDLVVYV